MSQKGGDLMQKLMENNALVKRLFEGFTSTSRRRYLYVCNMESNVSRWSSNAVGYFGMPGEYIADVEKVWGEKIHPDDRAKYYDDIQAVLSGEKDKHMLDYRVKNSKGEYVFCTCRGIVLHGKGDEPNLFLGTIENHSIMDNVDSTTNLYNVYEFWNTMYRMSQEPCEIVELLISPNHFSDINNIYGFDFGDAVLKEIGTKLMEVLAGEGIVFRMNGVRFSCCFKNKSDEFVELIYKQIQHALKYKLVVQDKRMPISVSGGMLRFSSDSDISSAQNGVTCALERSKYEKDGQLVVFSSGDTEDTKKNLELVTEIRNSILNDCDGFYLCYQPLIDAETERLFGAEALLRWHKEPYGEVPPGVFISWLENDPYFFDLGNWILERAMTEAKQTLDKYPDFVLDVNITYTQLKRKEFRKAVKEILEKTGYPPKNLCLELTERCRHLDRNYLRQEVEYLSSLGIKIAIDDFGTGFSSLDILFELKVNVLKFDRMFVMDVESNKTKQSVIRTMTELAKDIGIQVCLEGLETRSMIDFVKKYPVHSYQGYYYSRPIPMGEFTTKYVV